VAQVALEGLGRTFGGVVAVQDLNLRIDNAELVALLGPSGCGKTTTLLMLAGIYKPTQGLIRFDGVVVNELPPQDRNVGMVFQSYALYPHMSVFDNIAFPLRLARRPRDEMRRRVGRVAEMVQIDQLLERKPGQLSGGQQQRVALARALVKEPTLLLLDEPLSNLDAQLRLLMRVEIKRLQRTLGITTVLVTHDQVEAMTMADRIVILRNGVVQQIGSPHDLYHRPSNAFVGGFVGSPPMNFLSGRTATVDGRLVVESRESPAIRLPAPRHLANRPGNQGTRDLVLGIRPEDVRPSLDREPDGIEGRIVDVEPLGRELAVAIAVGRQYVVALTPPAFAGRPEDPVWLTLSPERLHAFDPTTGSVLT
jgi:inositol-phosphate transport system ATP-binding protein